MPFAKQDGSHNIRPSHLSDIEGRMIVLEVVAMTSLALVLDTSDEDNARVGRGILHLIREAVENKCEEMKLSDAATASAQQYADELMRTAMASLFPEQH